MKPMLPTLAFDIPNHKDWVYETKYDGFRAILKMDGTAIELLSRNNRSLMKQFPEIEFFYETHKQELAPYFPLLLDGELTILENPFKSNFAKMQARGRMRSTDRIDEAMKTDKATFLAFDLLIFKGEILTNKPYVERKQTLKKLFQLLDWPLKPTLQKDKSIQLIPFEEQFDQLWQKVKQANGEGIIAKKRNSRWVEGKRTKEWMKYKNWRTVSCFITSYEKDNGFFHVSVYKEGQIFPIGLFKNGMKNEEKRVLINIMRTNAVRETEKFIYINPSICVELFYLEYYDGALREPYFIKFLLNEDPNACTLNRMLTKQDELPVDITHPEKPLWPPALNIRKLDYLRYLATIYPYMSPFLFNRPLTVIRFPHGMAGEAFFQKNCPDYAPNFVKTYYHEGINYILCNNIETFLWLGNQLAIEFHIPFQPIDKKFPTEIVIDLDPPTKQEFSLAIEAAQIIKNEIIDPLHLKGFIKVSGSRGIQIYFPLSGEKISWDETHLFTKFVANYLITKNEQHFTIERLKKNRGGKLYIDYVQHREGKTIIAPYSLRGNNNAGVAAPIEWEELSSALKPDGFSIQDVIERVNKIGNPFATFFNVNNDEPLQNILSFLKQQKY